MPIKGKRHKIYIFYKKKLIFDISTLAQIFCVTIMVPFGENEHKKLKIKVFEFWRVFEILSR
jgi:hypothetical protein